MSGAAILLLFASAHVSGDQRLLDQISVSCGLSAGDITIKQGKLVRIRPKIVPSYEAIICTLPKLKKSGFILPIGFISEPPAEPRQ